MKKAVLYQKLPKKWVRCTACSWYCKIPPGLTGICGIRENRNGDLYLLVYGRCIGPEIDPIEKKPLFHFLPGSSAFSFGTLGCDFGCLFCQNSWHSQAPRELKVRLSNDKEKYDTGISLLLDRLCAEISPQDIVNLAIKYNCQSVAYTYNEPAIFVEYAYDTAKLARKHGLKNVFVSNGYESKETLEYIKPYLDAINIDLKSFREEFYQKICKARLAPVLENIKRVYQMGIWEEITTLIIPGENDSNKELKDIANFISSVSHDIPWHVTRFHPDYKMLDKSETPEDILIKAYQIGKKAGLNYVYVGNILYNQYESTYCPRCKTKLISRNWDQIEILNFKKGHCGKCGEKIAGRWN